MSRSEFIIQASRNTKLTGSAFNIRTRVVPAKKHNTFWREQSPSPVTVYKPQV